MCYIFKYVSIWESSYLLITYTQGMHLSKVTYYFGCTISERVQIQNKFNVFEYGWSKFKIVYPQNKYRFNKLCIIAPIGKKKLEVNKPIVVWRKNAFQMYDKLS